MLQEFFQPQLQSIIDLRLPSSSIHEVLVRRWLREEETRVEAGNVPGGAGSVLGVAMGIFLRLPRRIRRGPAWAAWETTFCHFFLRGSVGTTSYYFLERALVSMGGARAISITVLLRRGQGIADSPQDACIIPRKLNLLVTKCPRIGLRRARQACCHSLVGMPVSCVKPRE